MQSSPRSGIATDSPIHLLSDAILGGSKVDRIQSLPSHHFRNSFVAGGLWKKWGDDPRVGGCESMVTLAEMKIGLSGTSHQKVSGTKKVAGTEP